VNESPEPRENEPEPDPTQPPDGASPPPAGWVPPAGGSEGAPAAPPPGWSATPPPGGWPTPPPPGWSATPPPGSPPPRRRFSVLAGILVGVGAFILSALIATVLVLSSLGSTTSGIGPLIGVAVTFLIAPVVAIVMLFSPRTRPGAAGILIIFAAGWILLVGPCVAPAFVGYQA